MRKFIVLILLIIQISTIPVLGYVSETITEKDLTEIYSIALNSFILDQYTLDHISYISVDMSTQYYDNISINGREEILGSLKKYGKTLVTDSLEGLKQKGLADNYGNVNVSQNETVVKRGLILRIWKVSFISENEVQIQGDCYETPIAGKGFISTIIFKDEKWQLKNSKLLYVA
ncbi:hypothetical protein [Clostridium sp.]|uniref:hypothetical protein n=1 Tax=Clostridium sp. TaxID=1506 RepID=UPI002FC8892E